MERSPLILLSPELRNKIYSLAFEDPRQEVVLNLTHWQVPKPLRPLQPHQNVTQPKSYALTQTCRQLRAETLKLFYNTNTIILNMSDFEDHVSPILLPPRTAAQKLLTWRSLVGAEILQSARSRVFINLQYHYLGPGSKLLLDQKAAAILRETFSPSTTIEFSIKIHLPIPEGLKTQQGLPLTGLDVLGNVSESASEWRARVNEAAETFWRDWCLVNTMPDSDDRMEAIVDAAVEALLCGVDSIGDFWRPTFGPVLPPVMDFEREEVERRKRERDWQEVRERNRRIVVGDD